MSDKRQQVRVNGGPLTWEPAKRGVPQGAALGSLLFQPCLNESLTAANSSVLFADEKDLETHKQYVR